MKATPERLLFLSMQSLAKSWIYYHFVLQKSGQSIALTAPDVDIVNVKNRLGYAHNLHPWKIKKEKNATQLHLALWKAIGIL